MTKYLFTGILVIRTFLLIILMLAFNRLNAQENDIIYTIANDVQVASNQLEFDLLLFDPDPSGNYEVATVQAGVLVDPAIYNGGTITCAIIPGTSHLNPTQQPTSVTFTQSSNAIKLASKPLPGCGGGTIISMDPNNRTRICRLRLSNTVAFTSCQPANLTFSFTTSPYPTRVSFYQASDCANIASPVSASNCFSMAVNLPLNCATVCDPPLAFTVNGGGVYCQGGMGLPIGLSGSEADVSYTLYKGILALVTVPGPGGTFTFPGTYLAGTYTVVGTRVCQAPPNQTTTMTGSALISEDPLLPVSVSMVADTNPVCSGTAVIFTATPTNGGTSPGYQWKVNNVNAGTNSSTYSYIPLQNDVVQVILTSNASCQTGSPATSTPVTMTVIPLPPVTLSLNNIVVVNGQIQCNGAVQTITLAGGTGNFLVQTGGSAKLIAGLKIDMLSGTKVAPGGSMRAFISSNCSYCYAFPFKSFTALNPEEFNEISDSYPLRDKVPDNFFNIYPNPTAGSFTLELNGNIPSEDITVEIYGMRGEKVLTEVLKGERNHDFSLANKPVGLYFIHVISGKKTETGKIVKQ
jgi:hypothetical protein